MDYLGDFTVGAVVNVRVATLSPTAQVAMVSPTASVYRDANVAETTDGVTVSEDFDGVVGVLNIAVDTSANPTFYAAGRDFTVMLAGTLDGVAINVPAASFSLNNRSSLDLGATWDESLASHTTPGSAGEALLAAQNNVPPTAEDVAFAVWEEPTSAHAVSGSFGAEIISGLTSILTALGTLVADIWSYSSRTLTSAAGLTAAQVWSYATRTLTSISGAATVQSVVTTDGELNVTRGDDYKISAGNPVIISSDSWLNMSGWTITEVRLTIRDLEGKKVLVSETDHVASRVVGAGTQSFTFELLHGTSALGTLALTAGLAAFDVQVTHDGGLVHTPHISVVNVAEHYTRP